MSRHVGIGVIPEIPFGFGWRWKRWRRRGTPANHLAFAWGERKINFVGDHVMGWSTSIVAPPDGVVTLLRLRAPTRRLLPSWGLIPTWR
jgi:hypothetical protein